MPRSFGLRAAHHTGLAAWLFALASNAVFYFLRRSSAPAAPARQPADASAPAAPTPSSRDPLSSRRRFLAGGAKLFCLSGGALLAYGGLIAPRWFGVTRRTIPIRDLPPGLDGLRIVQLTDIHHGPWLSRRYVRDVIDADNALDADVICLTGDYVHHSAEYIEPVVAELARLQAKCGVVAILGNHDWWEGVEPMRRAFDRAGIPLIDNGRRILTPERRLVSSGDAGLALAAVGDLWEDKLDYHAALAGLPAAMPRLLLSHNPDVAEEPAFLAAGHRVDLMLSGHTHGGQIVLPFLGAPDTSSRHGQKYAQGLVQGPVCPVFICRGIGVSGFPIRLGATPEIAVLELRTSA
ncbi:MAG: metallophosphoesterase [Gemmataceae bacterium]